MQGARDLVVKGILVKTYVDSLYTVTVPPKTPAARRRSLSAGRSRPLLAGLHTLRPVPPRASRASLRLEASAGIRG